MSATDHEVAAASNATFRAPSPQISVAPMMDVTNRHCRYFLRQIAPDVRLYTEMLTAQAVLHGDRQRLLAFDPAEHPLGVQLAGSDPHELAQGARIAVAFGYDEVNLNLGCPSNRVQSGRFGACLMTDSERVAQCVAAMAEAVSVPVTVKTRIGVDEADSFDFLAGFVERIARTGCNTFIVHARKAVLRGLSPRENREIPPLRYPVVYQLKGEFPELTIILNGGVHTLEAIGEHLAHVDGVMLGRKACDDPYFLAAVQRRFLGTHHNVPAPDRELVVRRMYEYARGRNMCVRHVTRHMLGLYHGLPGARRWRRFLSEQSSRTDAAPEVLLESLKFAGADLA